MFQLLFALLAGGVAAASGGGSSSSPTASRSSRDDDTSDPGFDPAPTATPTATPTAVTVIETPTAPEASAREPAPDPEPVPDPSDYALSWAGLTEEEQLIVELINRARLDPQAEVDRLDEPLASGIPSYAVEPLAVTPELSAASREHSEDMDDREFFDHTNPDGQSPADRAVEEGHGSRYVGENIGWIASGRSVSEADEQARVEMHHANLWESDGHQRGLMNENFSEIGVGYDYGEKYGYQGSTHVTEMFGDRGINYLTGVVIRDGDDDDFYDLGEGVGGVRVTASDGTNAYGTSTWESGGYTLALPPGTYEVTFEGGDLRDTYASTVVIGDDNVKLDVIEDDLGAFAMTSAAPAPVEDSATLSGLPEVPPDPMPMPEEDEQNDLDLLLI